MEWQYLIVGLIVLAAVAVTARRLIRFFKSPASKCEGCSGCGLKDGNRVTKVTG
jgi:hypothetical protein